MKTEPIPSVLAPAHDITSSKFSLPRESSPLVPDSETTLFSPFVEKNGRLTTEIQSPEIQLLSEIVPQEPTAIPFINDFSTTHGISSMESGGEIERLRDQYAELEKAHFAEIETRRPDYLRRVHRDINLKKPFNGSNDLGIASTPLKGRRLQLFDFQQTSAESFEESLMTHGYGTYGDPHTPRRPFMTTEGLSKETLDWLAHNTPVASSDAIAVPETVCSEREYKKRRRLEAFTTTHTRSQLYPTIFEGFGRVLSNIPPEQLILDTSYTPSKKRTTGKRRRAMDKEKERERTPDVSNEVKEKMEPHWLDDQYPWCLPGKQREAERKKLDEERMNYLSIYFGHDSESEEERESAERELATLRDQKANEPGHRRGGRGKTVILSRNPNRAKVPDSKSGSKSLKFSTESSNAWEALYSRRSSRKLALQRLKFHGLKPSRSSGSDGRMACVCGKNETDDDGPPSVQCEDCCDWFHLPCIGIKDIEELGGPDDPWFCPKCLRRIGPSLFTSNAKRQPTFAPTDEEPLQSRDDVFNSSSPLGDWGSSGTLKTPIEHDGSRRRASQPSIWDDQSGLVRGLGHDKDGYELGYTYDPNNSPERMFPGRSKAFATPKNNSTGLGGGFGSSGFGMPWSMRSGGLFATPTRDFATKSLYISDDTPISRAPRDKDADRKLEGKMLSFPKSSTKDSSPKSNRENQSITDVQPQGEGVEAR